MSWKNWVRSNPLKAFLLILTIVAASVAVAYAYLRTLSPETGPQVSIVSYPLKLSIGLDKTEFQQGENITIHCSVENIGNKTITIFFYQEYGYVDNQNNYHRVYFDFIITDANGTEIYKWSHWRGALGTLYEITLNPEEEITQTNFWPQRTIYPEYVQVPAGVYSIKGTMPPGGAAFRINSGPGISLETPSITFTIK